MEKRGGACSSKKMVTGGLLFEASHLKKKKVFERRVYLTRLSFFLEGYGRKDKSPEGGVPHYE